MGRYHERPELPTKYAGKLGCGHNEKAPQLACQGPIIVRSAQTPPRGAWVMLQPIVSPRGGLSQLEKQFSKYADNKSDDYECTESIN